MQIVAWNEACPGTVEQGATVMKIFLAGATGAIGKRLVPLLLRAGHDVVGTTRSPTKAHALRAAGVEPVVVDVFDASALSRAVTDARADVVLHQLTDLPPGLDPTQMAEGTLRNARMRREGTKNLVAAMHRAGVYRLVAQSIAWMYAPGPEPHSEDDPLDVYAEGTRAITAAGVATSGLLSLRRQSRASPFATDISMGRALEPAQPENRRCFMSMRPPWPSCSPLRSRIAASTTLLNRTITSPRQERGRNSDSTHAFGRTLTLDDREMEFALQSYAGCESATR
jgi:hypothetical protein